MCASVAQVSCIAFFYYYKNCGCMSWTGMRAPASCGLIVTQCLMVTQAQRRSRRSTQLATPSSSLASPSLASRRRMRCVPNLHVLIPNVTVALSSMLCSRNGFASSPAALKLPVTVVPCRSLLAGPRSSASWQQ